MDPATYRRDPWLRTSASHLATWSFALLAIEFSVDFRVAGGAATAWVQTIVIVAASILSSLTTERRTAKMVGIAGEPVYRMTGALWRGTILLLGAATVLLVAVSRQELVVAAWLAGTGAAFAWWGTRTGFAWYVGLGAMLVACGLVDALLAETAGPPLAFRVLVLGLVIPVAALATNRRYLWLRPQA